MATSKSENSARVVDFYDHASRSVIAHSISARNQVRIIHLKNFNNWIKSVHINEYITALHEKSPTVLDLCCGKGGDQLKWAQSDVRHVTFIDISSGSIDVCQERYAQLRRRRSRLYSADFHVADCTKDLTRSVLHGRLYDLISCQFSFHYAFESLVQTRNFLANVGSSLRPGGYFIATIPNAYEVVRRARQAVCPDKPRALEQPITFGNAVYTITFPATSLLNQNDVPSATAARVDFPLFGARYDFHLEDAVDCPEYLVYPPLLNALAAEQGLVPVGEPIPFADYFQRTLAAPVRTDSDPRQLLVRMNVLESWPNPSYAEESQGEADVPRSLAGVTESDAYAHVEKRVKEDVACSQSSCLGTISKAEWDVINLYSLIAYKKQ